MLANRLMERLLVFVFVASTQIAFGGDPAVFNIDGIDEIAVVAKDRIQDYSVLWDQECLRSYQFFGLRFGTEKSHNIKFFYGSLRQFAALKRETVTAMAELPVRDGKLHGKVRRWTPDGKLLLEVPFVNGQIHGECRFYSHSGKLLGTSTLENGNGIYRVWQASNEEPTVIREIEYVDGKRVSDEA